MIYTVEKNLSSFDFWSSAKNFAEMLTLEELDQLDDLLPELFGEEIPTETQINDLFWFDFETVCELLGYEYDSEHDKVIRDDSDREDDEEEETEE